MSASAPQSKLPSPSRTPRVSVNDERRKDNRPPGITNLGMTCFLNSTFQAVSAAVFRRTSLGHRTHCFSLLRHQRSSRYSVTIQQSLCARVRGRSFLRRHKTIE